VLGLGQQLAGCAGRCRLPCALVLVCSAHCAPPWWPDVEGDWALSIMRQASGEPLESAVTCVYTRVDMQ
jgi:hypothetical protein